MIDTTFGSKYKIHQLLGRGGMGAVYSGQNVQDGTAVAIKVIDAAEIDEATMRRFQREGRAASALEHEHIVKVYETRKDEGSGRWYMVMELLAGEDLQGLVERVGALEPHVAIAIVTQALEGLAAAHAGGIVHRDIKPSNVFLAQDETGKVTVKVLDFGIAKILADPLQSTQSAGLTATGNLLGSPLYMSPEQVMNSRDVDGRTDVWSMGSTLYCALTGRAPHAAVDTIGRLLFTICSAPPPPLPVVAPWLDPALVSVVQRSLAIDRERRYASAGDMLAALAPFIPPGFTLTTSAFVAVSHETRSRPRASATGEPVAFADTEQAAARPGDASMPQAGTTNNATELDTTARTLPRALPKTWPIAVGAVCLGLLGMFVMFSSSSQTPAKNGASSSALNPGSSADASLLAGKRFKLAITPQDGEVEVDGRAVPVLAGGFIEMEGSLGSTHRVRVRKGTAETTVEVFVTDSGLRPTIVALDRANEANAVVASTATPASPPASADSPSAAQSAANLPRPTSGTKPTPPANATTVPNKKKPSPVDGIERHAE